jgi:TolB-like protein/tetratricopeptide (TPR) repeat protein
MEKDQLSRKLAVILHADVVGSTSLVQQNEMLAHERIQAAFHNFSETIKSYGGIAREIRGDALVAEFDRASDAASAALAFQDLNGEFNSTLDDDIQPQVRIGISLGEVIIADNTITGAGVVLAQRLEQLAEPGGVVVQGSVSETVPTRMPFEFEYLGEQDLKGFDKPVRAFSASLQEGKTLPAPEVSSSPQSRDPVNLKVADKPSIAVLPFDNLSGDPSQQYLVDAITEDLVSNMAHDLWFDVIARASTQKFKDDKAGTANIAAELGARYIVDGSLRKAGDRIRVSVMLIDGSDGRQIWDQRFERVVDDLFALQDEIAMCIAGAVIPEVNTAEQRLAMRKHPQNLDAWSSCHKAFAHLYTFEIPQLELAQSLFKQAIEHDPSYSQPYAGLAYSQMMTLWYDSSKQALLETASQNARHAIQLDNRDSWAHFALGRILSMQCQYDEATLELERAIELNPSFGRAYFGLASVAVYSANYTQALEPIDTAIRLSPADPHLWTFYGIKARALTGLEQYEEAVYWARKAVRQPSATFWCDLALISALGYLGREDEARLAIQELYRKKPGYSLEQYNRDDFVLAPAAHQLAVEGLRRAGLPDRTKPPR